MTWWLKRIIAIFVVGVLFGLVMGWSLAEEYTAPDIIQYYKSLQQPDSKWSCCGPADAYYAVASPCNEREKKSPDGCAIVAVIIDTRPATLILPNGEVIQRVYRPVGERHVVPPHKVRRPPIPNPDDHAIVFLSIAGNVYCWEPKAGL